MSIRRLALLSLALALLTLPTARADRGHVSGRPRPFVVTVRSEPVYQIRATTEKEYLEAADGTRLFLETWLPEDAAGAVPTGIPTILVVTPYVKQGTLESAATMQAMVPRGYAYAQLHVRGTGESEGCIDLYGPREAEDGAMAIEHVARAPWSSGVVGGYGVSYPGGTILSAAGRGDPAKTKYLKAVLAGAPAVSLYESAWIFDGVPSFLIPQLYTGQYMTTTSLPPGENGQPVQYAEQYGQKPRCYPDHTRAALDTSGDFTPYFQERENRDWVKRIKAAVFTFHGHADVVPYRGVAPMLQLGLFDRLPATTPKFGIFGLFGHENPSNARSGVAPDLRRHDFMDMQIAWFDHHLKGIDSGVDEWGVAQVQGTDGRWRVARDWPRGAGRHQERLWLGAGKMVTKASATGGASSYVEPGFQTTQGFAPGTSVTFDSGPLNGRLELTGQPLLDVWVQLTSPDAHLAARLDAFDAQGEPVPVGSTYALRSARHLEPFADGRFRQAEGEAPPTGVPFRTTLRFQPTDIVVPAGGSLRLTMAGSVIVNPGLQQIREDGVPVHVPEPLFHGPSQPSGMAGQVTVLHDRAHPSVLRFETPGSRPDWIQPA